MDIAQQKRAKQGDQGAQLFIKDPIRVMKRQLDRFGEVDQQPKVIEGRGGHRAAAIASVVFNEALAVVRDQDAGFEVDRFGPTQARLIGPFLEALQDRRVQT